MLSRIKENLIQVQKHFTFSAISVLQEVKLNCSETITYVNAILGWFQSQHYESADLPHSPLQAAFLPLYGSITFTH
jgi:hypothetical protein